MNTYIIYFPTQGQPAIQVQAKKVVLDDNGQKVFYGQNGDDIVAIAAPETTILKKE